ncbi:TlpA family protein disulfide reductase [Cryobacterium sp. TMS1-20-1]|uniref:peroxiredoxin family protein n=1 Tax=Cryobacterium sp. TMS1-20-1 TaxID=1259223 RepID=UPI00106D1177|nr:TlpA disulfide reductase family protein [Cryobacterium sp. TMS1-20-1]TFC78886.1 TlpA family protein disulfide reductase [Cryobacterium sp. TMS1-20-1]
MSVTIFFQEEGQILQDARADGDQLWVSPDELEVVSGWIVKPQGLCKTDACVPLPADGSWRDAEGRINLVAFAERLGRSVVRDEEHSIWAFGESVGAHLSATLSAEAPEFTLPDLEGKMHSLSTYRGKKVFLYSWGSYCGCSFDLPVWQVIYEELKDQNFEIISVALDTAGSDAVEARIHPDLAERPEVMQRLRGWSDDEWSRQAAPAYPCLIDEEHVIADLYGMTNVPMAVWIDEAGQVVRPAEPAGVSDHFRRLDAETFAIPDEDATSLQANRRLYVDALRDWVQKGAKSEYVLSTDEVVARTRRPSENDVRAAAHVRIARHLYQEGASEAAKQHLETAARLCPEKETYRRQSRVLEPDLVGSIDVSAQYFEAQNTRDGSTFYPTVNMPGVIGPPAWLSGVQS